MQQKDRIAWWVTPEGGIRAGKHMHDAQAGPFATRQEAFDARDQLEGGQARIEVPDGTIRPEVKLIGADGNAFTVLGLTARALREAGNTDEVVSSYIDQASSGDYDQLLRVTMEFAEVN